ncbi:MAG TPA: hypothetical protein VLI67_05395 [Vicinamibacteria bacterium]|nr:hypothetical protein [Vicinamibacteria bacterium]
MNVFERFLSLWVVIMLVASAPVVKFLVSGASGLHVPFAVLIGASNFFELAVATAIALYGPGSGAAAVLGPVSSPEA